MDPATPPDPSSTTAPGSALDVLVDVVRSVTGADRVEAALTGSADVATSGAEVGALEPTVFEVADDDGALGELRVYGSGPDRLREVLPYAGALLAVVAGRERRPSLERVWVGRLGHDLKTPLTAVLGFAGLLGGGGVAAAGPELVEAATRVTEAGERLLADLEEDLSRWRYPPV